MKLATMKNGSRDGKLVVVSRDLTRFTDASFLAPTLQAALDDWRRISPHLATLGESLETGSVPSARFHEHDALSPLPRAYQHSAGVDALIAARDPILLADEAVSVGASVAVITGDLAAAADREQATEAIALVLLAAGQHRGGEPCAISAFSPVAVTLDEMSGAWKSGGVELPLHMSVNGRPSEEAAGAVGSTDFGELVAAASSRRPLGAGAVIAAPAAVRSPPLSRGDIIRIEMKSRQGESIFGAIEQTVQTFEV